MKVNIEEILSGKIDYNEIQFRNDLIKLNKRYSDEGLTSNSFLIIEKVIEDLKIHNHPKQILDDFMEANYHYFYDNPDCNVVILNEQFELTASATELIFLIYATFLKRRLINKEIDIDKFKSIEKQYLDAYHKFNKEVSIQMSLIQVSKRL